MSALPSGPTALRCLVEDVRMSNAAEGTWPVLAHIRDKTRGPEGAWKKPYLLWALLIAGMNIGTKCLNFLFHVFKSSTSHILIITGQTLTNLFIFWFCQRNWFILFKLCCFFFHSFPWFMWKPSLWGDSVLQDPCRKPWVFHDFAISLSWNPSSSALSNFVSPDIHFNIWSRWQINDSVADDTMFLGVPLICICKDRQKKKKKINNKICS